MINEKFSSVENTKYQSGSQPVTYHHQFRVRASLERVAAFHSRAASMAAITPPPIIIRMHRPPVILADGDKIDFTMWLGPLPVRWQAQIESVSLASFSDRQLQGPFAAWLHQHSFIAIDQHTTEVVDEVTLRLRSHLFWGPVGLGMKLGLPFLFAYRGWKTKKVLESSKKENLNDAY
jgi:ligand-binding SRPBCC domain-containing protein